MNSKLPVLFAVTALALLGVQSPAEAEVRRFLYCATPDGAQKEGKSGTGIVIFDIDKGHGGEDSLQRLQARHAALPRTPEVRTGGGGRHLYFRYPGMMLRNRTGLAPGLDLRAEGGYVVAPPSLHPSGQHYTWAEAAHIDAGGASRGS